ncbi:MAG: hypothetical protein IKU16_08535 [Muribaculaceae bacterium]|nr:hypothetical protein [Muribaculaceae bacterium]
MKKLLLSVLVFGLFAVAPMEAQLTKDQQKQRKEQVSQQRKALNSKASKDARKEAKKFKKEGWQTTPGTLTLEKQLDRSMMMQMDVDQSGYPLYIMGEAMSIGETYDAAKMQALELAKQNLAGQIQTEITALVENTVANKQLAEEEAASIAETVLASKNLISQSIGRVIPVVELYRDLPNKNKEVLVRIAYNHNMAMEAAKKIIRKDLEEKGNKLHDQLDEVLGW